METLTEEITSETLTNAERSARLLVRAKDAQTEAKKVYDTTRATTIEAFATEGVDTVFVDGHKVEVVQVTGRDFDVDALEALIPATLFRQVIKVSVDLEAFDKAVRDGLIDPSVEISVVTPKESVRVDVRKGAVASIAELVKK